MASDLFTQSKSEIDEVLLNSGIVAGCEESSDST